MRHIVKLVDFSLLSALVTGALYVLGYRYLVAFYGEFGLNIQVRDPDAPQILAIGFKFSWLLALLVVLCIALYWAARNTMVRILKRRSAQRTSADLTARRVAYTLSLGTLVGGYAAIDEAVTYLANLDSKKITETRRTQPETIVKLRSGSTLQGSNRLFFFGKTYVVLLDVSRLPVGSRPRVHVIPSSEILELTVSP